MHASFYSSLNRNTMERDLLLSVPPRRKAAAPTRRESLRPTPTLGSHAPRRKLCLPSFNSQYLNISSHIAKDKENIALALSPHRVMTDNDLAESYCIGLGKVH